MKIIINADDFGLTSGVTYGIFDAMKNKMNKAINKYPDMSSSIIDYSDPSDLPEIFFKREWSWFQQIFSKTWDEWREKFATMNEIRNIKLHNKAH